MLSLTLKSPPTVPVDAEGLLPGREDATPLAERTVLAGGVPTPAGELFTIRGNPRDLEWRFEGDLSRVRHLGAGLRAGRIVIDGDVGRHCGAALRGGEIVVHGDAGDWLGAEMRGGEIHVRGSAGNCVGGGYTGSKFGMRGGAIVVDGPVGNYAGRQMRRGVLIAVGGCGDLPGFRMRAGSLLVLGRCGANPGLEMLRGTLGLFGGGAPPATFSPACTISPPTLTLLRREVRRRAGGEAADAVPATVTLHNGDLLRGGRGELLTLTN
ncbi:Formyltransferase/hydrolase complex Fhc subunit C [Posidoniimonas polymericola]|uniref:Formyltransferase/hydrolase complex Fhc subunit C n=1 Tax=Posidoniimonas polymericola TaxID=2528002 RepID=A0A5C5XW64_9BACT|nr:formylmethanofuran dehydrogenase subunit C [Posidoniimonas polymericola]TWT66771.1 Formyltransferase/hydrolase complex Fhc subunit C [Posidoniimonas polymericola]